MPLLRPVRSLTIGLLILWQLFLPPLPLGGAQDSAEELYSRGLAHLQDNNFKEAVQAMEDALAQNPSLEGGRLNLGIAYFQLGKYEEALGELNEALEKNPKEGSLHFFLGLSHQQQKNYDKSITHFQTAARLDSEFTQLAEYNIGMIEFQNDAFDLASSALERAIRADPHSAIAAEAKKLRDTVEAKKNPKRLSVSAGIGLEYDDNVTVDELDQTTNLDDFSTVFEFSGAYKLLSGSKYEVEAGYDFYQSVYHELSAFDLQSHLFSLAGSRELWEMDFALNTLYNRTSLGGDKFLEIHSASPSVGFFSLPTVYTTLSYSYRDANFFNDPDRDSQNHGFSFNNFMFFMGSKGFVSLGYTFENEITTGDAFDFFGHFLNVGVRSPIPGTDWDTRVGLGYKYYFKDYKNVTASIGEERADYKHTLLFGVEQPFMQYFKARLDYQYINSTSNLASSDFDENIVNFSITAYY